MNENTTTTTTTKKKGEAYRVVKNLKKMLTMTASSRAAYKDDLQDALHDAIRLVRNQNKLLKAMSKKLEEPVILYIGEDAIRYSSIFMAAEAIHTSVLKLHEALNTRDGYVKMIHGKKIYIDEPLENEEDSEIFIEYFRDMSL